MISDRILRFTLTVSLLAHGAILLQSPRFNPFTPAPKIQEIAVRYIKENPQSGPIPKGLVEPGRQKLMPVPEPFLKLDSKIITGNRRLPLPYVEQENSAVSEKDVLAVSSDSRGAVAGSAQTRNLPAFRQSQSGTHGSIGVSKPTFVNSEVMAIKKKITLPAIEMAKIDNPSYISYYQIVREKIRRSAYQNYTHNETGEVYVSFIISNDGYIKEVRLVEEKTTVNDYLKNIALRSIRDASPFPNFPKELDYPQLSFNIIISFEIE